MKIGIYSRILKTQDIPFLQQLFDTIFDSHCNIHIYEPFYQQLYGKVNFKRTIRLFNDNENLKGQIDYLFSIGGDGTLLNTITLVKDSKIPVVGINVGRLGLLTTANKNDIKQLLYDLKYKRYFLDKRSLLHLDSKPALFDNTPYALNEFTIHKHATSALITVHIYVDNVFLNSYWADGIIVATPTGSTAYSLSCGGPIVHPSSKAFIITPVAPHNLNVRPIVIPDNCEITFKIEGRSNDFLCTLDSRYETVTSENTLSLTKEKFKLHLVRTENQNFFSTIRNKLMWGVDSRN
ncbi:MAG: NAD kinase [Chitinophagales bacterium]